MTNIETMGVNAASPAAIQQAVTGLIGNPGVFKQYTGGNSMSTAVAVANPVVAIPVAATPASVSGLETLLTTGNQLFAQYVDLKATVLDRSDCFFWNYLSTVYDYVLTINASVVKRETKAALIKTVKERDGATLSSSSTTEAIVVRYLFPNVARQTRNNYVIVFEKAIALEKQAGELFAFLKENDGVAHVVDKNFGGEEADISNKEALKAERAQKVSLMRRMLSTKPHCGLSSKMSAAEVDDYCPSVEEYEALTDAKKSDPKNQRGDFVFFVAVPGASVDEYAVVQGFKATRDFEENMFFEIAKRMKVELPELKETVECLEKAAFEAAIVQ
jgi:hypothetical protein